jgi:hypothetical protein
LFAIIFIVVTGQLVQAQSSSTTHATATIISANTINITKQTDTSFAYSTIINSPVSSHSGVTPVHNAQTFCMANISINGEAFSEFSFTIPPTITLNHASKADKIRLETFIKRSSHLAWSDEMENIQIDCSVNFKAPVTTGLYNSNPFAVIINYN